VAVGALLRDILRPGRGAIESLAVLPFENGSRQPDTEYLSDGLTEGLIDRLSHLPGIRVMARATVFRFRKAPDPQEAGRKLGVNAVVAGEVSRRGDRLAVSVELLDVETGARLWGNHYDRPFSDLVRVQAELASDVSAGLGLRLSEPERRSLVRHGTEDSEAYDLYLRGRFASLEDTEAGYREAVRLFRAAREKDPGFAEAYLFEGDTWGELVTGGFVAPAAGWPRSDAGARKALSLDPNLSEARAALAMRRALFDWDFDGAESELRELFAGPRPPLWHTRGFALLLWARGKTEEAIVEMERTRRVDPGNVVNTIALGDYQAQAGRPGEAVGLYRAAIEAEPDDPRPYFGLAAVHRSRGDAQEAIENLRKAYELAGEDEGVAALARARTAADYDAAQAAVARARLAGLRELARERYVSPLELARLEAVAEEREAAFADLEAALAERSPGLVFLDVDHAWDSIRGDPRFASVRRRVGLP
jgi:TolB-like protein